MKSIRLKELRMEAGLTQQELADRLGISKQAVSMYELGNRRPAFDIAEAIAGFFGVSIGYLSGSTEERGPAGGSDSDLGDLGNRLAPDEYALLVAYRSAPAELKKATLRLLEVK